MKKQYVIRNTSTSLCFSGGDWDGAYFDKDYIKYFDTEGEALNRLAEEAILFPMQFANQSFEIAMVYKFV